METLIAFLETMIVLILLPYLIRWIANIIFAIQTIHKHGPLFPYVSEEDKALLDRESSIWIDPLDNAMRPFYWYYWWRLLRKNK